MIAVGHQPQYLPYMGLFNKIAKGDIFVFVDNVQFLKKSWQSRTLVKGINGQEILMSIPVQVKGKFCQQIKDVLIAEGFLIKKHLKTIEFNYRKTTGFDEVYPIIAKYYKSNIKYLVDITIPLMREMFSLLNIEKTIFIGSELGIEKTKTELLVDICLKTGADSYLSGQGARNYITPDLFGKIKLSHYRNIFKHPHYSQTGKDFSTGMATLDLLFNEGIQNSRKIFWDNVSQNSYE
jgi:hypothetical protein